MTRYELDLIFDALSKNVKRIEFPGSKTALDYIDIDAMSDLDKIDFDGDLAGRVKITDDFTMDDIITVLSDGLAMSDAFERVDYDRLAYNQARDHLRQLGWHDDDITHEAVQAQMLIDGKEIVLYEVECHDKHSLTLEKLIKGFNKSIADMQEQLGCNKMHAIMVVLAHGDFFDYEGILQNAIFGEVVYG